MNIRIPIDAYEEDVREEINQSTYTKEQLSYISFLKYFVNNINGLCAEYYKTTNKYKVHNKESFAIGVLISYNEGKEIYHNLPAKNYAGFDKISKEITDMHNRLAFLRRVYREIIKSYNEILNEESNASIIEISQSNDMTVTFAIKQRYFGYKFADDMNALAAKYEKDFFDLTKFIIKDTQAELDNLKMQINYNKRAHPIAGTIRKFILSKKKNDIDTMLTA